MLAFIDAAGSFDELAVSPNDGLHELVGNKADTLMRMQTTCDLAQARARADKIVIDKVLPAA